MDQFMAEPGVVAIGRNEGERLRLCLESVVGHAQAVVYVDSGSSDGSVELARSLGVEKAGWTILRIDAEMTLHDMAMTRFGQWWKRAVRAGHAFTEGAAMHGAPPE